MSQIQLAVATQLHESVISRILAGKREINVYHLDKILMALQLDILALLHYPEKVYLAYASNEKITITLTPNPTTL
jgi:transcriptional regulator with XRE-family HTH domain